MTIYVGGDKINQIYIGGNQTVRQVWYGNKLVWEIEATMQSNVPITKTIYLTPGVYEIYVVGGGGGTGAAGGGGGSISDGTGWRAANGGS